MKRFRCGDVVAGCETTFQGSHDEVVAALADHLLRQHALLRPPADLLARVELEMVQVA